MWAFPRRAASTVLLTSVIPLAAWTQSPPNAIMPEIQAQHAAPSINDPTQETTCAVLRKQSAQAISGRDYAAAAILLREASPVCADQAEVLIELAKTEMLSKQFEASANTLNTLLTRNSHNVEALIVQGELFYLIGKSSDAVASLSRAIATAPDRADPHYLLGRIYYERSDALRAKAQFQTALQLDSNTYKAYDGLALCYENLGDTGRAAQTYMRGIEAVYKAHPDYDVVYADFAELMLRFNENQKAFDLAGEAVQRNPHSARNYLLAGRALKQAAKYQDSLRWLQRAAQMDPTYPDPHFQLARVYRKLGELAKAKQEANLFQKLSAQAPSVRR
jgi:tetratricopeptide (TPR) repeat protein